MHVLVIKFVFYHFVCTYIHQERRKTHHLCPPVSFYLSETLVDGWAVCAFCAVVCASPVCFQVFVFSGLTLFSPFQCLFLFLLFIFLFFSLSNGLRATKVFNNRRLHNHAAKCVWFFPFSKNQFFRDEKNFEKRCDLPRPLPRCSASPRLLGTCR